MTNGTQAPFFPGLVLVDILVLQKSSAFFFDGKASAKFPFGSVFVSADTLLLLASPAKFKRGQSLRSLCPMEHVFDGQATYEIP